jgi:ketosteroid isomerase-like protein
VLTRWRYVCLSVAAAGLVTGSAGCGQSAEMTDAATAVAQRLLTSAASGDGAAACATLAPDTVAELQKSAGKPCAEAITEEQLPGPGTVHTVDVYGQWARVVTSEDTVFLGAFGDGWRVVAAGCERRAQRPYDCTLQGG